jgi:hypothetical protein
MVHDVVFNTNSPNLVFWASIVVDIQTLSVIVASASVVAGIVYYAVQFRHQTRIRQTDLLLRLYTQFPPTKNGWRLGKESTKLK